MKRTVIQDLARAGEVRVSGWVHTRRDHGGLIFIDLRDHTGLVQLVIHPDENEAFTLAEEARSEFVLEAEGIIKERDEHLKNPNLSTGDIEIVVSRIRILNRSLPLPIALHEETPSSGEELRLKYRFLDLRRAKMQTMLRRRSEYNKIIRAYMDERDFIEVTTPILANSSPEGARDFLIPSRLHPDKFYALPQAPQQFKQLLMVGGIPRYYQLATCFRDEDPRADRLYGEFYQLDLEMSFIEDGEEVRHMMEPLITNLVTDFAGKKLHQKTVPRLTYQEAMDRFGTDKPDLRFGMELTDLSDVFKKTEFGVFRTTLAGGGVVKAIRVEGGARLSRSQLDHFTELAKSEGAAGLAYLIFEDGEIKSPIAKFLSAHELAAVKERIGAKPGDIVFFAADHRKVANKVLGMLRSTFGDYFGLKDPNVIALAWIVDFPFYEWDEKAKRLDFGHNPFSMPKGGLDAIRGDKKEEILADQFDMVANGYEVCSGAVRNYAPDVMYEAFAAVGYNKEYVDSRFGAMINAFKYGAPPHAGCAFGIDRLFMVLMGEDNIREIVAFPKNGSGIDMMMNSPNLVDPAQLKELSIKQDT